MRLVSCLLWVAVMEMSCGASTPPSFQAPVEEGGTDAVQTGGVSPSVPNTLPTVGCRVGEKRCQGTHLDQCADDGKTWTVLESCVSSCDAASTTCTLPMLEVTSPNSEWEGDVVVEGEVVVRSGASILTKTGNLTLRAKKIWVENGGAIVSRATGDQLEGKGRHATLAVTSGVCSSGGSGGGYGERGGASFFSGGVPHGLTTDAEVTAGSAGGQGQNTDCSDYAEGGLGGGRIRLEADTLLLEGWVLANGADGVSDVGSGGGGSGGGILLAANHLQIAQGATVSVAGGAGGLSSGGGTQGGKGGRGRIKVLSGASSEVSGTLDGVVTQGLLPPLRISSSSHPSSERVYNDGFSSVELSWNRAFESRLGYYYVLNNLPQKVPTPAIGKFTALETLSLSPSMWVQGANYFHITSVDAQSNVGTVETVFKLQLNTQPPILTSQSHPSSQTWTENSDAFFNWTFPVAEENFRGVYYVLDAYGNTMPGKSDTFLPITQKQILRPGLTDGIWVFHLVSEDTMGYLNKTARHFIIRVGKNPGTGQVLTVVKNSSGQTVNGAKITINRGLLSAPDTVNGNSTASNIPVGTWEVTVTKSGFQPATAPVVVNKDLVSTVNVTLNP